MIYRPNATHGGGRACYYGHRPKTGTCDDCRSTHARQQTNHNRSPSHAAARARYRSTAKGVLTEVRKNARQKGRA